MKTLLLLIIAVVVLYLGYNVYQDNAAEDAGKDEPISCIMGYSNNC